MHDSISYNTYLDRYVLVSVVETYPFASIKFPTRWVRALDGVNGTGIRVGTVDPGLAETEFSLVRFKGDAERAKNVYAGIHALTAEDIAEILVWVASRPPHVNIDELLVKPVDQAAMHKIYRRKN